LSQLPQWRNRGSSLGEIWKIGSFVILGGNAGHRSYNKILGEKRQKKVKKMAEK
jgi:hypothetical protein